MLPLELKEGQKLSLTLGAADGDDQPARIRSVASRSTF